MRPQPTVSACIHTWASSFRWLILIMIWLLASSAWPQNRIFRWVDKKGVVHFTDRLGDIPEPYYSMYAEEIRKTLEEQAQNTPKETPKVAPSHPEPSAPSPLPSTTEPSYIEQEAQRRLYWQNEVARWRKELSEATEAYAAAEEAAGWASANPILVQTPAGQANLAQAQTKLEQAKVRLEKARYMLLEEIPKKAKEQRVPLKWLQ